MKCAIRRCLSLSDSSTGEEKKVSPVYQKQDETFNQKVKAARCYRYSTPAAITRAAN